MDISIPPKKKDLDRDGDTTRLLEVTVIGGFQMEIYALRKTLSVSIVVIDSTRRPTTVKNVAVTALQRILTPLFITVDIFALVVPYLFDV